MKLIEKNCYVVYFFILAQCWTDLFHLPILTSYFPYYMLLSVLGFFYCCSVAEIVVICYIWLKVTCIDYKFVANFPVWFFQRARRRPRLRSHHERQRLQPGSHWLCSENQAVLSKLPPFMLVNRDTDKVFNHF